MTVSEKGLSWSADIPVVHQCQDWVHGHGQQVKAQILLENVLCCLSLGLHQLCKIREGESDLIVHKCVFSLISVHLHLVDSVLCDDTAEQAEEMQLPHGVEAVIKKSVILHLDDAVTHVCELISLNTVKIMLQDHQLTVIDEL